MRFFILIAILLAAQKLYAEQTKTIFNPFTSKLDYITALSTSSIGAGTGISVSTTSAGVTITNTGSSSISTCGTSPVGIQFTDTASCTWCETIDTSGVLTTALITCPSAGGFILMEDGTYILQEDGTKIVVE